MPHTSDSLHAAEVSREAAKYPQATECLTKDRDVLLAFYDFPAEHWPHLRTTNRSSPETAESPPLNCGDVFKTFVSEGDTNWLVFVQGNDD